MVTQVPLKYTDKKKYSDLQRSFSNTYTLGDNLYLDTEEMAIVILDGLKSNKMQYWNVALTQLDKKKET